MNSVFAPRILTWRRTRHAVPQNQVFAARFVQYRERNHGRGIIAGRGIGIVTVGGRPASRRILLIERERFKVIDDTWSADDGSYLFEQLDTGQDFLVIALDHKRQYEPVCYDYVRAVEDTP
ncbi:Uncharacterised protein [Kingella potus]|uniref:Uncharacterized protein n=2 Tax=Kingella potus TaxID=265175 RepID=A0A377QXX2_9NEIS|nr:Uncharacterised protein [Kingella potus]STR02402.1 Uncharacterised protein [Kingella potus]